MDIPNWISRARIPAGLPIENRTRVIRMSALAGTGAECDYCRTPIGSRAVEYEVDAYVGAGRRTLHFHGVCLQVWEELFSLGRVN